MNDITVKSVAFQNELRTVQAGIVSNTVAFQNELRTVQAGIVSNTVKIMSDSDITNQRCDKLEKCVELLTEELKKMPNRQFNLQSLFQRQLVKTKKLVS